MAKKRVTKRKVYESDESVRRMQLFESVKYRGRYFNGEIVTLHDWYFVTQAPLHFPDGYRKQLYDLPRTLRTNVFREYRDALLELKVITPEMIYLKGKWRIREDALWGGISDAEIASLGEI